MGSTTANRKLLLVASTGGHLAELVRLLPVLNASDDSLWVTFRSPQSEALLRGRRVFYVPYVKPRDVLAVLRVMGITLRRLRHERFDGAVSTGSGIALACFPAAILRGIPTKYVESLGRVSAPSATGRILAALGATAMFTQSERMARGRWSPHPSVLSTYRAVPRPTDSRPPRLFVTLGTIRGYRFDALVDAVLASGLADERTVWQVGETVRRDLPGTVYQYLSAEDYVAAARDADVVISHAGVGSLLVLLEAGVYPILVTRRAHRNEHVDDHQLELREVVRGRGVARVVDVEELDAALIQRVRALEVTDRLEGISDRRTALAG
ncbi:glycosyltransferase [Naasia sp. SYSU D00948]|uniref:glycosyltransferase n=1 Tax=Naasia sp. SYSU D00948 TaxID=2817379 RepID=UPI001B30E53B|nr:glycosyltransferase [Naasia sp. SYSU D00948]